MSARRPTAATSRAQGKGQQGQEGQQGQNGQEPAGPARSGARARVSRAKRARASRARARVRVRVRVSRVKVASAGPVRTVKAAATAAAPMDVWATSPAASIAAVRGPAAMQPGAAGGTVAGLTQEDIRQFRGEARQYSQDAKALRGMLQGEKIDPRELDEILRALRQLEDERVYQNVQELARLQQFVAEGLKRFEFGLRRQVDADKNASALTGADEVPEEFRKLVEQYYRSLAKSPR